MEDGAYLYFIRQGNDGPIKIGITKNLQSRVSSLQTANPTKLTLTHTESFDTEKEAKLWEYRFHSLFSHLCISGEWFAPKPYVLERVECVRVGGVKNIPEFCFDLDDMFLYYEVWDTIAESWSHIARIANEYKKHGDKQACLFIRREIEDLLESM